MTPRHDADGGKRKPRAKEALKVDVVSMPAADSETRLTKALNLVRSACARHRRVRGKPRQRFPE